MSNLVDGQPLVAMNLQSTGSVVNAHEQKIALACHYGEQCGRVGARLEPCMPNVERNVAEPSSEAIVEIVASSHISLQSV